MNFFAVVRLEILPNYETFFPEYNTNKTIEIKLDHVGTSDLFEKRLLVPMGGADIEKIYEVLVDN